jgi:putative transposase
MSSLFVALFALVASSFRTRTALQAEILALRHQLAVIQKNAPPRLRLQRSDRLLWVLLSRWWPGWRHSLHIVRPDTVLAWHRRAFAWYWTRKSRRRPGRPNVAAEIRNLIRNMSQANPLWGAPRIHGELLKLGIEVAQSTVAKYLRRPRKPPSQTWRTFLTNHMEQMSSIDFFVVPTATFRVLFVFVVLSHARRRVLHFQVTEHPSQEWTMQQMREALPWDHGCRYLLRDRDAIYGGDLGAMTKGMGMEEVLTAPRSPWQNPYVERLIGSIRRECLDHIIVWNERSLRRTLQSYFAYYQRSRTHLALAKDAPESRAVEKPERGRIIVIPQVGGLHHRYQRRAA